AVRMGTDYDINVSPKNLQKATDMPTRRSQAMMQRFEKGQLLHGPTTRLALLACIVLLTSACKQGEQTRSFAKSGSYKYGSGKTSPQSNSADALSNGTATEDDRVLTGIPVQPVIESEDDEDFTPVGKKGPGKFVADFRTSNDFFTRMDGPLAGNSPHGTVQIWYSSNLLTMIDRPTFVAPEGTVAIKVYKNDDGEGIVTMIKKEQGYDRDHNDWR